MFKVKRRNRQRIAAQLFLIAHGCAKRFSKNCRWPDALDDAAASATMHAIKVIRKFNPDRSDANAFSYFTSVIMREIVRELKKSAKHRERFRSVENLYHMDLLKNGQNSRRYGVKRFGGNKGYEAIVDFLEN